MPPQVPTFRRQIQPNLLEIKIFDGEYAARVFLSNKSSGSKPSLRDHPSVNMCTGTVARRM